jgi:hypothetical protein
VSLSTSQSWAVIGLAALVWLALSVFGVTSGGGLAVVFSLRDIIPALVFGFSLYERWGWRWQLLHKLRVVKTPVVIGTWRGDLTSSFQEAPGTVYLAVSQTLTTVSVRLLSADSTSVSIAGGVAKTESGFPVIAYNFRNRPRVALRHNGSEMHYGGALVEIIGDPAAGLDGEYWTERATKGEFKPRAHSPVIAQTFEEAEKLLYGAPRPLGVLDGLLRLLGRN